MSLSMDQPSIHTDQKLSDYTVPNSGVEGILTHWYFQCQQSCSNEEIIMALVYKSRREKLDHDENYNKITKHFNNNKIFYLLNNVIVYSVSLGQNIQ